jgi:putative ABC transport system permease protein
MYRTTILSGAITVPRVHKSIIIRTHADSKALMQNMRQIISELAPESAIFGITTVEQTVSQSATPWRFLSQLLELFAAIALLLAVIAIYGVVSYSIGERVPPKYSLLDQLGEFC